MSIGGTESKAQGSPLPMTSIDSTDRPNVCSTVRPSTSSSSSRGRTRVGTAIIVHYEGERRRDGRWRGCGKDRSFGGLFPIEDRGLKKGISEKSRPSARVGEDAGPQGETSDCVKGERHTVNPGPVEILTCLYHVPQPLAQNVRSLCLTSPAASP